MAYRRFRVPPYGCTLTVTDKAARAARMASSMGFSKENLLTQEDDGAAGVTYFDGPDILVCVWDGKRGTVVHECVHAALYILDRAGIDARSNGGECLAYLTDWLFDECSRTLFKET